MVARLPGSVASRPSYVNRLVSPGGGQTKPFLQDLVGLVPEWRHAESAVTRKISKNLDNRPTTPPRHYVLLVSADARRQLLLKSTVVPRLKAAGADLDRVRALADVEVSGNRRRLVLPGDLPVVKEAIARV